MESLENGELQPNWEQFSEIIPLDSKGFLLDNFLSGKRIAWTLNPGSFKLKIWVNSEDRTHSIVDSQAFQNGTYGYFENTGFFDGRNIVSRYASFGHRHSQAEARELEMKVEGLLRKYFNIT